MKKIVFLFLLVVVVLSCKRNSPPTASFSVNPTSGDTETGFLFDASGSTDAETTANQLQVRWDWENSGTWTPFSTTKTASHQFKVAGEYTVKLEVKDSSGLVGTTIRTLSVTKPPNKAPTASFTVSPETGTVSALFAFDASGCTDAETPVGQLQVRWDWDGNGTWTPFTETKTASHLYAQAGSYTVVMEVKDGDGLTSTVSKTITVSATAVAAAAAAATPVVVPDGNITDPRDKNTYPYKRIGTQTWMIKNLAWLPAVSPSKDGSETSPYYYVYAYHGSSVSAAKATPNYATYGVLYNWEAAKKACPSGWHLPSDDEWKVLEKYLGMSEADANTYNNRRSGVVGGKLKESGTGHWRSPNQGANNSSGFMALPGGNRGNDRVFDILVNYAYFWSSSESGSLSVWSRDLDYGSDGVGRYVSSRSVGFSVRCLRND